MNKLTTDTQPKAVHGTSKFPSQDPPLSAIPECRVIVEDISNSLDAVQLKSLEASPEKTHSATSRLDLDKNFLNNIHTRESINWPDMDDEELWSQLDSSVHPLLRKSKSIAERIQLLEESIYDKALSLFGAKPPPSRSQQCSRKDNKRTKLLTLKKQTIVNIKCATSQSQIEGLHQILNKCKADIRVLRKNEHSRKKRWNKKKQRENFKRNPWVTGKNLLRPKENVSPAVPLEVLDNFLLKSTSDTNKYVPLTPLDGLPDAPQVKVPFNSTRFNYNDFEKLIKSRRNSSKPGSNGIPYKVYKRCTMISCFLFDIFCRCSRNGIVPIMWRHAFIKFIPKVDTPKESQITDFRQIALLNVEGKLFFSLVSSRLTKHIVHKNQFIDLSSQKGCMEGVPGCWEHMSMIWDTFKDARLHNKSVSTVWLDVANAYGSIPHELIFFALKRYGVPNHWIELIRTYYDGLWSKSNSETARSSWHRHMRGIFAGCTLSIILFLAGMNVIIEYTILVDFQGFITSSKTVLPLVRAFMDDLNLQSVVVANTQCLLFRCTTALTWARMDFRAKKSRSLVMIDGKTIDIEPFQISSADPPTENDDSNIIPSIQRIPVKFLGRKIDSSLTDRARVVEIERDLRDGLDKIDKSRQLGINKVWIMQNLLLPQIRWYLTIYEISMTAAEALEKSLSKFIRKWMGIHQSTSSTGFYNKNAPCPLPLKSFTSILKASKVSAFLLLRDSKDPLVSSSVPTIVTGTSWHVEDAVNDAEQELSFREKFGHFQYGRAGLGLVPNKPVPPKGTKEYRRLISDIVCEQDDKRRFSQAVQLSVQGQWTAWSDYIQYNLSWATLWSLPANLVSFCLASTYNTLGSPSNLHRWKIQDTNTCSLCSKVGTVSHILSGCNFSLVGGRYTRRHDSVLLVLYEGLKSHVNTIRPSSTPRIIPIKFVKAGSRAKSVKSKLSGLLHKAGDWKILADFNDSLVFPLQIVFTLARPDIVIYSDSIKTVLPIELTCPCEENFSVRHNYKINKYSNLVELIELNNWECHFFAIEVGARGYCATSVSSFLKRIGFKPKAAKKFQNELSLASMRASFQLWLARDNKDWKPEQISHPDFPCSSSRQFSPSVNKGTQCSSDDKFTSFKSRPVDTPLSSVNKGTQCSAVPKSQSSKHCSNNNPLSPRPSLVTPPVGLNNLGNTCYANCILQALQVFPRFWLSGDNTSKSTPFLKSFYLLMSLMKNGTTRLDPRFFLSKLGSVISKSQGRAFNINNPQDSSEVLQFILNELIVGSPDCHSKVTSEVSTCITCNTCLSDKLSLDIHTIIRLPVADRLDDCIATHFNQHASNEFCTLCNCLQDATTERSFRKCPDILILHIDRNISFQGNTIKDDRRIIVPELLTLSEISDNEVSSRHQYSLKAVISHSGSSLSGHYTAHVNHSCQWFFCNDNLVSKCKISSVKPSYINMLFYERR